MKLDGEKLRLSFSRYAHNNRVCIELISVEDHMPYAVATVNVPHVELEEGEVLIKNYSENEGVLEMLEKEKVVIRTGRTIQSGHVDIPICKLLVPLKTI
jgi:hypothetical protein